MKKKAVINDTPVCQIRMQAISDTMSILSGRWKCHILGTVVEGGKLGVVELMRGRDGIGRKMPSNELQGRGLNHVAARSVSGPQPSTVEYAITQSAGTLAPGCNDLPRCGKSY